VGAVRKRDALNREIESIDRETASFDRERGHPNRVIDSFDLERSRANREIAPLSRKRDLLSRFRELVFRVIQDLPAQCERRWVKGAMFTLSCDALRPMS